MRINRRIDEIKLFKTTERLRSANSRADEELLTVWDDSLNVVVDLGDFVLEDGNSYDVSTCSACSSEGLFGGHEHIWHVLGINLKNTFYSQRIGRCRTISKGLASAAMTIRWVMPLLRVLVDSLAPFLICLRDAHWATRSLISEASYYVAMGCALYPVPKIVTHKKYHLDDLLLI